MFRAIQQKLVSKLFSGHVLRKISSSLESVKHSRGQKVLKIVFLERPLLKAGKQDCKALDSTRVELKDFKARHKYMNTRDYWEKLQIDWRMVLFSENWWSCCAFST